MQNSSIATNEYFYINKPEVFLKTKHGDGGSVSARVVMGEYADITKFGWTGSRNLGYTNWFQVKTSDGRFGYISENDIFKRKTPYDTTVRIDRLKTTLYRETGDQEGVTKSPDSLIHQGTRLKFLKNDGLWIMVELPDSRTFFVKKDKVVVEQPEEQI